MGSPDFAVPSLEVLAAHYPIVGVVTQPDRPAGRGGTLHPPAVKAAAIRLGIPFIQPEKVRTPEAMTQLQDWYPDLIVVAAFGQILRPALLDLPRYGCINVHGSLLPRGRGAAPIQAAILAGDQETGITIMKMDPGVDTGPILSQRTLPITPDDTGGMLFEKMASLGAELLLETLPRYLSGVLVPRPQPEEGATYAPLLKKEDGFLDFTRPAIELERRVRAMNPWPGAYFDWNGAPLKVLRASLSGEKSPGVKRRLTFDGRPAVGTSEGILVLEEVQPAGKKVMPGRAFLAGTRAWSITNNGE
ncbi:MAG: methionyl-tRNA formyltransferase [Chloroflexi bacterium]|nr:methionyl-tRNA formyltransferase [Chloroflexota bacterium]